MTKEQFQIRLQAMMDGRDISIEDAAGATGITERRLEEMLAGSRAPTAEAMERILNAVHNIAWYQMEHEEDEWPRNIREYTEEEE